MRTLRDERLAQDINQPTLERLSGINQAQISKIERGLQTPNRISRQKLEEALHTKIDWVQTENITDTATYRQTEHLVNRLISKYILLCKEDRRSIKELINKHINK
jgi:transcriptional regulator with XRE-family HTH domain